MGFATAGASFDEKAPLGSSRLRIDNAIRAIRSMTPKLDEPSVVLASIEKAIVKLAGEEAERRAVVVISDSDPSTSGVSESKIADLARDNQVALYLVSFGRNKQEPSVVLKKLGRDSRGGTHDVTDLPRQQLLEFASELSTHLENGFILSFDARGLPQASEIRLSANLDGVGQASADPITVERQTEDSWIDAGRSFVSDNLFMQHWGWVSEGFLSCARLEQRTDPLGSPIAMVRLMRSRALTITSTPVKQRSSEILFPMPMEENQRPGWKLSAIMEKECRCIPEIFRSGAARTAIFAWKTRRYTASTP